MSVTVDRLHPKVAEAISKHSLQLEIMECDPNMADTAAFCEHYKIAPEMTCNAIIVVGKSTPVTYVCCVVLATCKLDVNKTVSSLIGIKRCSFATAEQTIDATDMQIGGVTPVGIENIPVYFDKAIAGIDEVILGGGNRSTKLKIKPSELTKIPNVQFIENLGLPR